MIKADCPWQMHARTFLTRTFLPRARGQAFLAEQFARAAEKAGVPVPVNRRAWGAFIKTMKRDGVIRATGYGLDQYGSPKTMWRAAA